MSEPTTRRKAIAFGLTLGAAAVLAEVARPRPRDQVRSRIPLEDVFPREAGDWRVDAMVRSFVQPSDETGKLYRIYDQVLERTYRSASGERVMLSVAYGTEQSPAVQMHRPEVCYVASGFRLLDLRRQEVAFGTHKVRVTRLHAWKAGRSEPITYWTVLGDTVVPDGTAFRRQQLAQALRGDVRDGMLVRISSLAPNAEAGYASHVAFAEKLLVAIPRQHRDRVFGSLPAT